MAATVTNWETAALLEPVERDVRLDFFRGIGLWMIFLDHSRVEDWRAGRPFDRATFPVPATSHTACGFPALRAPIGFTPRLMGPIRLGPLSVRRVALDSR